MLRYISTIFLSLVLTMLILGEGRAEMRTSAPDNRAKVLLNDGTWYYLPGRRMDANTNFPAAGYDESALPLPDPRACRRRCRDDRRCQAWTFVKPGVQGPGARCRLMRRVPAAQTSQCCVSGVVQAPPRPGRADACNSYARTAVRQNRANIRRGCGFGGPRWQSNFDNHFNWCMNVRRRQRERESRARDDQLAACARAARAEVMQVARAVPRQESEAFRDRVDARLEVDTTRFDRVPYRMHRPITERVRLAPGERLVLAGDPAGTLGWKVDNFLLIEIRGRGRTRTLLVGKSDPVYLNGELVETVGPPSHRFGPGEIDLTPYMPGPRARITVHAFDYGGIGYVSDVFLVKR